MNEPSPIFRNEDEWTSRLERILPRRPDVVTGIGDDAAVVRPPGSSFDLVYTTDAVVESVHFLPGTEPERIGHKMVGRLLSDLGAMGAEPDHVLLNLVTGRATAADTLERIYRGAEKLATAFGASIIGGDTIRGDALALHGFASGHVPRGYAVLRSGARPGDAIYVTGELGGSIAGKHLDFTPRVREGRWLANGRWATAMMDLSDGLARDLRRICARSGAGADIRAHAVPVSPHVLETSDPATALRHALADGEDYELLFTIPPDRVDAFEPAWRKAFELPVTRIGVTVPAECGIVLTTHDGRVEPLSNIGFDHLSG